MSTAIRAVGRLGLSWPDVDEWDLAALLSLAACSAASLAVLYHVADVAGTRNEFVVLVALAILIAVAARPLSHVQATAVAVVILAAGLVVYLSTVPQAYIEALSVGRVFKDMVALLTGFPILRLPAAGHWALAVAPGPTFLAWYFGARREYVRAATIGAGMLGFFVLTGDSGAVGTLVGVLGATGTIAFSTLGQYGGSRRHLELVAFVLALMVVASASVTAVPGGRSPLLPQSSAPGSLVSADDSIGIGGSISLSPKVQFVVQSEEPQYWRVAAYDRYVGDGWVRTGNPTGGDDFGGGPVGTTRTITQQVTVKRPLDAVPAAASPVDVDGIAATRTGFGDYVPKETIQTNDTYTVQSEVPVTTRLALRTAGTDYPDTIREHYLNAPAATQRVRDLSANITSDGQTPYAKAVAIEQWLEANKEYSLDAPTPNGNVVDSFLFERNTGYCTYYASAMVVMLRSEGVPARFVTGYTEGQRVAEHTWVVRGVNSHAWVEVYFPDVGWVRFDPTPGSERASEESTIVSSARQQGVEGVDAAGSQNGTWTPPEPENGSGGETANNTTTTPIRVGGRIAGPDQIGNPGALINSTNTTNTTAGSVTDPASGQGGSGLVPTLPGPETLTLWTVLGAGLLAGLRRSGLPTRAYRALWLHTTPRGTPAERIDGAYQRVAHVLAHQHRPRRDGETIREYLDAIDAPKPARQVAALRELARYRDTATTADAQRATHLAKQYAAKTSGIASLGRGDSV